ncbi:hypothetical protein F5876DRAFT_91409 [Lentinula aff. lateritia]|uniref:Uncharacterized protein n=1 Tax=Lentinula aff. lateritia TaxID=2804960 RepID=A0ACC1TM50_9AGAR|nr:hypothetical protein F5876DRAFT_91409 [Lentinula aff. lateritia]
MFGFSIAILGGQGLNSDQEATLAGIPETIETLEGKFNLDVDCVPYAIFKYYLFFDWFGKFLALPDIEEYGNKFCDTVCSHQTIPNDKTDQTDGRFFHEFHAHDGQLFIANRGEEGRWFFVFNADFFNVEGNYIRGKTSSTGMMAMSWIIQGPHEPNAGDAEHCHYLPLIDDLVKGFTRVYQWDPRDR